MNYFRSALFCLFLFLTACATHESIVNNVDEREANEIVVFLASKGIAAQKIQTPVSTTGGGSTTILFSIDVNPDQATDAMALLNRYGLPRRTGTNLLELFAKSGLISSDREETIRYQAGLAEELQNTILKIDGVIDANVQLSFPSTDTAPAPGAPLPKVTAAVYIKHQGIMEDPNSHMEIKIKRLLAGSVNGLSYDDVAVISDRARFSDIQLHPEGEVIGARALQQTYVKIWGLVLTKASLLRFRLIFFSLIVLLLGLGGAVGFLVYKFYPAFILKKKKEEPLGTSEKFQ